MSDLLKLSTALPGDVVVDGDRSLYAAYRESGLRELTGGAS